MATIVIKDLISGKELDQRAMASIRGGWQFGNPYSGAQTQDMSGTPPANPSAFVSGPSTIQVNNSPDQNSPDQNPYSFRDLARKHTNYF